MPGWEQATDSFVFQATGDLDASVFLEDPPHKQAYEGWIANGGVNLELKTDDISEILARDDALRKIHTRLGK